ncbi:SDR family oxidoreductase [Oceaniradius stylonematis]|uniref:SDR family oxidoreductase n=1 Tax=Oceaniradius stylonematis TaxID=2184161 RepID=A0A3A8AKV9_9HYPH|nr:SDR family oxidoreductase [Oceaniradius stylonematis]RKF06351.1 SDR family oxidoreductase [Oceaniradius stylonematis]RNC93807.1 MAG: SDR family oxidoreductase [Oricola sp.]
MDQLASQTAIVTGASRGIGEAAARELAKAGMNVVLAARTADDIERVAAGIAEDGGTALALVCDVARHASVEALVERTVETFGGVDVLVNNAGVINPIARLAESDPEAWGNAVDINLKGVYHGVRAVLPAMVENGSGTIINLSSGAAYGPMEGWSHYCATKAAVLMLTRAVDKEYRDRGIRAVGLSPGTVATQMQVDIKASGINPVSQMDPSVHAPPEWIGRAIGWLAGEGADNYLGDDLQLRSDADARTAIGLPPAA